MSKAQQLPVGLIISWMTKLTDEGLVRSRLEQATNSIVD
jgi:hypothetical protein